MAEIFRVEDRWGRPIVLTREQWLTHVEPKHTEFAGRAMVLADVLTNPAFVHHDKSHAGREVFYRPSSLPYPWDHHLIKVVVDFVSGGTVITAHLVGKTHPKEKRKWP